MGSLHLNPSDAQAWTRRRFLHSGLALASAAVTVPQFIQRSALAMAGPAGAGTSLPGVPQDRILVVVQLSGGNDGLNTVVPFRDDSYRRVRPSIALREGEVQELSRHGAAGAGEVGLHPALSSVRELYDEGLVAIAQGVGYPNPNRSHFKSMDIWHTADTSGTGTGWLGRYVDSQCCGFGAGESGRKPDAGVEQAGAPIAIGRTAPLALQGSVVKPVAFESPELFTWLGDGVHPALSAPYRDLAARKPEGEHDHDTTAAFLMRTAMDAQVSSEQIRRAVSQRPLVSYPNSGLAQQLSMIGSMIRSGLSTRVYYCSHGSFDTHAGQGGANGRHAQLLTQWGEAVRAFYADLKAQGNDTRVLTMSFSEFGRRVGQNASGGTDHGTAAPMFLFGPMVKPGVWNDHPSLSDLDEGDLKYSVDFRSVYANVLDDWLRADAEKVLEERFRATKIIRG
jgi:uncharacterized protein (DUF1501 family)